MINVLRTLWELPQIIVGIFFILCKFNKIESVFKTDEEVIVVTLNDFNSGVSFGRLIVLGSHFSGSTYLHELGHTKQSLYLGPLYLLVIGIPSLIHNVIHGLCGRKWNYYKFYTEAWANKLVGINKN